MNTKFLNEEKSKLLNPVDWFNFFGDFKIIFDNNKNYHHVTDTEVANMNDLKTIIFKLLPSGMVDVSSPNEFDIATGCKCSKFMLFCAVKFKGDYFAAISYISYTLIKNEIPYIRVGTDYYKVIKKEDRYGAMNTLLKPWKKEEIKQDHNKQLLSFIFKFDDFCLIPNNKEFISVKNNCYNLYSKFSHTPYQKDVSLKDIPVTLEMLNHIFGDQVQTGLKYMKILFENPTQILPVLVLVSTERETGKTTFLNWISMIFGENSVLISPDELTHNFNSGYANKNIIMVDETIIEKSTSVEKLKSLATAKSISVQQKFVQQYSIPFFGKVIICTNKEKDFMKIDEEEVRFWIRKIKVIDGKKNTLIEEQLFQEIPNFLKLLTLMPDIDFTNSRMVFTKEEIQTTSLSEVKEESKSQLRKEIEMHLEDFFYNTALTEMEATAKDLKNKWFSGNHNISIAYIRKVLKDEMKLESLEPKRYLAFGEPNPFDKTGRPYLFKSENKEIIKQFENQILSNNLIDDPF